MEQDLATLQVISETLKEDPHASQRTLAKKANMSLGMMNAILGRFLERGWIMLTNVNGRKLAYAVTPEGISELAKRGKSFALRTFKLANVYSEALDKLLALGNLDGSILHSDQGVLYTSKKWRKRLKKNGIIQSMSRKGNCWDNACMEHFFGTLKVESGYDDLLKSGLLSYEETKKLIDDFIEYYNNERIQQNLGWKTPNEVVA